MSDYTVLAAWNGSGTALVFESADARDELLELYEQFRKEHSFPWVTCKEAVRGEDVLEMWRLGFKPWSVLMSREGVPRHAKALPIHHLGSTPAAEHYDNGDVRVLQVWAEDEDKALQYAAKMLQTSNAPAEPSVLGYSQDVDFGNTDYAPVDTSHITLPYSGPRRGANSDILKTATKVQQTSIPGFGQVLDLGSL